MKEGCCCLFSQSVSSVAQSCPTPCNPIDGSTPGFPVHHQFPEPAQTHVRRVSDATQPSHPLSSQMSQLSASGGQSIGVSASVSVLSMNIQDWFPLGVTGWISLLSKGLSRVFSNTTVQKRQFLVLSLIYGLILTSVYDHWKNHTMIMQNFVGKVMPLLLNTLSRFFIVFISRSMCLLISWLQSPSAVILEPNM